MPPIVRYSEIALVRILWLRFVFVEAFLWCVSKRLCKAKPADDSIQGLEQCGNLRPASLVSANPTTDLEKYLVEPLT
jgi:hypothetical protein